MIRKKRKNINMTQEELAEAIGVTPGAIGQYERGESVPNSENMISLIQRLCLNPEEVFLGEAKSNPEYVELCSLFSQMDDIQKSF